MNILYIVPYVPNLIRVRSYQLIRALLRRGHNVTLATVWTSEQERADLRTLTEEGVRVLTCQQPIWRSFANTLRALPTRLPLQAVYSWQPALVRTLLQTVQHERFDVLHVEHLRAAQYGLEIKTWGTDHKPPLPVVWDSVDCISHLFAQAAQGSRTLKGRLLSHMELNRTRGYEGWLVHQFNQVVVTSTADQAALAQLAQQNRTVKTKGSDSFDHRCNLHVVANGVDLDYFSPNCIMADPATVVFSGKMSYHANITAVLHLIKDIMPLVWAQRPDVQVCIAGKDPAPEIRALATHPVTNAGQPRVVVTGTIADIRPYLHKATLAVASIPYGAGIQNKVLEAMACGVPVVASPQATSALNIQPGREVMVANKVEEFAKAILDLLDDPIRRRQLGQAGRTYVERNHSWDTAAAQLEAIYGVAINERAMVA